MKKIQNDLFKILGVLLVVLFCFGFLGEMMFFLRKNNLPDLPAKVNSEEFYSIGEKLINSNFQRVQYYPADGDLTFNGIGIYNFSNKICSFENGVSKDQNKCLDDLGTNSFELEELKRFFEQNTFIGEIRKELYFVDGKYEDLVLFEGRKNTSFSVKGYLYVPSTVNSLKVGEKFGHFIIKKIQEIEESLYYVEIVFENL